MMSWLRIALFTMFAVCGQTSAVLLTRLYYEKGGTSRWVGTLVQLVGFPVLFPCYFCFRSQPEVAIAMITPSSRVNIKPPSRRVLVFVYVSLGLLAAVCSFLLSVGIQYLPASTVTIISASQLAFNALFSYFLNSQKFTPFVVNSLVLLTVSSLLLVANSESEKPVGVTKRQYAAGFICTISGAAMIGLMLASLELAFRKVLKKQTLKVVMDVIIYQLLVASIVISIGFFASGDWKGLKKEMKSYEMGKLSYIMTLLWTCLAYQMFTFGGIALIFEVSALFSNVCAAMALPITTITAIFVFNDKMNGVKGISMGLAIWGFASYVYQQYLDDCKLNAENKNGSEDEVSQA